jgi:murein DD-endopeptidase / murein LD-carboxypeptidase
MNQKLVSVMCGKISILLIFFLVIIGCHSSKKIQKSPPKKNSDQALLDQYSAIIGEQVSNGKLFKTVDLFMGTPYKYGGKDLSGIDCSGLVTAIYRDALGETLVGPSYTMYEKVKSVKTDELYEGDLVFFKIKSNRVSHVGIYLANRKFIHSSSSKGVIISSLDDKYYSTYYIGGGRIE